VIPQLVTVGYRRAGRDWRRLHVPVLPVALVASPLLLLAVLAGLVACAVFRVNPAGSLRAVTQLLWALPGTRIEVAEGRTALLLNIR
jgi:hypothetical protein